MILNNPFEKIEKIYQQGGIRLLSKRVAQKIFHHIFYGNDALWVRLHSEKLIEPGLADNNNVKVIFDAPEETIKYIQGRGYYYPREIEVALRNNHIYSRLMVGGQIGGYNKLSFNQVYIYDFDRILRLPKGVAFTYDTMIELEIRNKGLGAFLLSEAIKEARRRGVRQVWGHIPPWNKASLRMHQNLGFKAERHIKFGCYLGIKMYSYQPEKLFHPGEWYI